jgi:hypothetical protein
MKSFFGAGSQLRARVRDTFTGAAAPAMFTPGWRTRFATVMMLWLALGLIAVPSAAPQDVPSGTIELSGGTLAAGIGYTWGSGTLIFGGKKYDLSVSGISLANAGFSGYTASGTVYNLKQLSEFNGVYTAASPRSSLVEGASTIAIKNPNGVLIQMAATHTGAGFSLGPNGVTITVKQ